MTSPAPPEGPPEAPPEEPPAPPPLVLVRFEPSGREVRIALGATLLGAARAAGLTVANACGASGVCGKCGMVILDGHASLADPTPWEVRVKAMNRVAKPVRLACLVHLRGDLVATTDYW